MPREAVLDASAVLSLLQGERGADRVAECLPGARISAVNLAEVVGKLSETGMPAGLIQSVLSGLGLRVVALDESAAFEVGLLRRATRAQGLSLGDRACIALSASSGLPALTADRAWASLNGGAQVEIIR